MFTGVDCTPELIDDGDIETRSALLALSERNLLLTGSDSKVHGANIGPIWGRQDQGGPYVGPMNFAI